MNKKGHTEDFTLDDYADSINNYIGAERIDFVTFNIKKPDRRLIERYESQQELLIRFNEADRGKRRYQIIRADMLSHAKPRYAKSDSLSAQRALIRHDSDRLAKTLMMILELVDYRNIVKDII